MAKSEEKMMQQNSDKSNFELLAANCELVKKQKPTRRIENEITIEKTHIFFAIQDYFSTIEKKKAGHR
jgi:hypothetical protein